MHTCPDCQHHFTAALGDLSAGFACRQCGSLRWAVHACVDQVEGLDAARIPAVMLEATEKDAAIRELVAAIVQQGGLGSSDEGPIVQAILEREALGPTGIGRGCAFPHARWENCPAVAVAIGVSAAGIEYESLDGQPVHLIILVVSPASDPGAHLRTLEGISRNLRGLL